MLSSNTKHSNTKPVSPTGGFSPAGKKKILSTGLSGLVGSRIQEMLSDKYEFLNMDLSTGVDITNKQAILDFINKNPADTLIHLAAFTNPNEAFNQTNNKEGICYKVNVDGTQNITDICKEKGIYLIHISTDFVFDGKKESPYKEDDSTSAIEWYGETKAIAEQVVEKSGINYAIVRLAYPYRKEFEAKPDIIKKIRLGLESEKLYPQFADTIITPTFIDDIVRGIEKLIDDKPQGIYHFTGNTSLSPFELAKKVAASYGFDPDTIKEGNLTEYLKSASRPFARNVAMDNSKAAKELGIKFATIDEGLTAITN